jgi:hypothetical protein
VDRKNFGEVASNKRDTKNGDMTNHDSKKQRIEEEAQRTLESLDSIELLEGSPFFMTRLRQAIEDRESVSQNWLYRFTRGYRLVPVGLLLFIFINAMSLAVSLTDRQSSTDVRSVLLRQAAQEYYSFVGDYDDQVSTEGR